VAMPRQLPPRRACDACTPARCPDLPQIAPRRLPSDGEAATRCGSAGKVAQQP
jgi:hypothetical protein